MGREITTASAFLGTGWSFPPVFDPTLIQPTVVMSSGDENIRECLWVLFSTSLGERIMAATYGSGLRAKVFDALTETLINDIRSLILKAILDWEPRIDVTRVEVAPVDPAAGLVAISVDYIVRQTNARSNLVYPFYLNEATLAPPEM
ncbi:GPW/gp25 family protein [Sphingomonas soli]|uniref:GPW/gp25 family protein n=1 Tax=Sphingomonas soli TaxID=266127 RepID=UPI0008358F76|nr:GPW/gp25 family protein [Sphingomonas soli]